MLHPLKMVKTPLLIAFAITMLLFIPTFGQNIKLDTIKIVQNENIVIDSNTEYDVDIYAWQIKEDSLFLDGLGSISIKELSKNNLIVEHEIFGKQRLEFIKK